MLIKLTPGFLFSGKRSTQQGLRSSLWTNPSYSTSTIYKMIFPFLLEGSLIQMENSNSNKLSSSRTYSINFFPFFPFLLLSFSVCYIQKKKQLIMKRHSLGAKDGKILQKEFYRKLQGLIGLKFVNKHNMRSLSW